MTVSHEVIISTQKGDTYLGFVTVIVGRERFSRGYARHQSAVRAEVRARAALHRKQYRVTHELGWGKLILLLGRIKFYSHTAYSHDRLKRAERRTIELLDAWTHKTRSR